MIIVTGLERRADTFVNDKGEKIPYDNTLIHYITDTSRNVTGFKGCSMKAKTTMLTQCLGCKIEDLPTVLNFKSVMFECDFSVNPPVLTEILVIGDGLTIAGGNK